MKILELRFKNLNSLYGEWRIDFSIAEYESAGIFLLAGPTGAGKSTILDAICLALYGATPRLEKITKSDNEIMSRGTGECFAEVLFESPEGRYRCHWSQHRARQKASGNLADSKHEISDAETGEILESKKREVAEAIEEKTGLDFDRFTRSVLLAQGSFDNFLKADDEQKSKILEQITGTEIYTEISKRVHERQKGESEKLELLRAEVRGISLLEASEEIELRKELEEKQARKIETETRKNQMIAAIDWHKNIRLLSQEAETLALEIAQSEENLRAFFPEREKLRSAEKAAEVEPFYIALANEEKRFDDDKKMLQTKRERLPQIRLSTEEKQELANKQEEFLKTVKKKKADALPQIQNARRLDQQIEGEKQNLNRARVSAQEEAAKIAAEEQSLQTLLEEEVKAREKLRIIQDLAESTAIDDSLSTELTGIEERLKNLKATKEEIENKEFDFKQAEENQKKAEDKVSFSEIKKEKINARYKLQEEKKKALIEEHEKLLAGKLLRELRDEKDALLREARLLQTIVDLEAERAKLKSGEPCPLCGSKEHPFARENPPAIDATEQRIDLLTEQIAKAEKLESEIQKSKNEPETILRESSQIQEEINKAGYEKQLSENRKKEIEQTLEKLREQFQESGNVLAESLRPFGIEFSQISNFSEVSETLRRRIEERQKLRTEKEKSETEVSSFTVRLEKTEAVLETLRATHAEKRQTAEKLRQILEDSIRKRRESFGEKNPDTEETKLEKSIGRAEEAKTAAQFALDQARGNLRNIETEIESLQERIELGEEAVKEARENFRQALGRFGFSEKQEFMNCRLPADEREKVKAREKSLDDYHASLLSKKEDRENRLKAEIEKKRTEIGLEECEKNRDEISAVLSELQEEILTVKHRLASDHEAKMKIREKQTAIEVQKKEWEKWQKLHGMIGSADGKKYRNFAQGLTFEQMVIHANRQLQTMTDRYLLIRDDRSPLDLNVIDNYQAGEIRSSRNLSGGERFIVSLALALGLSKMAGQKIRVDSLFLDEGFGTLDEDSLEIALEALSGLQYEGKLIGVISHVPALKERIATQIRILPGTGGKSTLKGPGCSQS